MSDRWISQRAHGINASGIRKVFDLAASLKNPINLSIGQPHYDTPEPIKDALYRAVREGRNAYSPSQGIAPLLDRLQGDIDAEYGHGDRKVFVTSGTSGGLMLSLAAVVDPGDEVIVFDPYFVMYKHLVTLCGGVAKIIDTYPDFDIDLDKVRDAITPRTKAILCNSPANPTGAVLSAATLKGLADIAAEKDVALISDEIYRAFSYDGDFASPAKWNPETLVIDGFSKTWSMTGHRCGWAHGPKHLVEQMIKLQQYTFVCSPHPVQWAALAALDVAVDGFVDDYRRKRGFMVENLKDLYDVRGANGAFYLFIKSPRGTGTQFVEAALKENLLVIPGSVFSEQDTHFRVSYAADDAT
ncbi:MAG: pyridoxal phosphate-dependent aminotransferase, partial [Planctomycetaceae bacterium]|nr:pyridoxal phosphate-dependent aminotransferase [Planctomycetaceae bacterium]